MSCKGRTAQDGIICYYSTVLLSPSRLIARSEVLPNNCATGTDEQHPTNLYFKPSTSFLPSSMSSTMPQVQSLPTVLPESFNTSDKIVKIRSAYSMTLLLEHAASSNTDPKIRGRKLIHARVLGHLLREAPSMRATENVADQVNSCQNNDQLDALGEMYFLHYICACEPPHTLVVVCATLIPCGQSGVGKTATKTPSLHLTLPLFSRLLKPKES
jgi:hypothetical protein